jgi:diguanylate cyclase (GGDEF)-like protein/PAS domain S-box-containing protein
VRGDLELLEAAFGALEEGVVILDPDGRIVACNRAAAEILGLTADELLGSSPERNPLGDVRFKDDTALTAENSPGRGVRRTGVPERGWVFHFPHPRSGEDRWIEVNYQPLTREGEESPWGIVCSFRDVTASRTQESLLAAFSQHLDAVLESESPVMVYLKDREGRYMFANPSLAEAFEMEHRELLGRRDRDFMPPDLAKACEKSDARALGERHPVEVEEIYGDADERRYSLTIKFPLVDDRGEPYAIVGVSTDITERKRAELALRERQKELSELAFEDALTGLANRRRLEQDLERALAQAKRRGGRLGLLFIDIDDLKQINDTHGHAAGDDLMRQVAERLSDHVRQGDSLARGDESSDVLGRHGGDEFLLLLADLESEKALWRVEARLRRALQEPLSIDHKRVRVSASFGGSVYPDDGETVEELLRRADEAMYRRKDERAEGA